MAIRAACHTGPLACAEQIMLDHSGLDQSPLLAEAVIAVETFHVLLYPRGASPARLLHSRYSALVKSILRTRYAACAYKDADSNSCCMPKHQIPAQHMKAGGKQLPTQH